MTSLDIRREQRTVYIVGGLTFSDKAEALAHAAAEAIEEKVAQPGAVSANIAFLARVVANADEVLAILTEYIRLRDVP